MTIPLKPNGLTNKPDQDDNLGTDSKASSPNKPILSLECKRPFATHSLNPRYFKMQLTTTKRLMVLRTLMLFSILCLLEVTPYKFGFKTSSQHRKEEKREYKGLNVNEQRFLL